MIPAAERKNIMSIALINARTAKTLIDDQGKNIDTYEKLVLRYEVEWHRKFALSFACLTLFFIGAPLGAIIRKGGIGLPTVVSIGMFIIFYVISIIGEKAAKQGAVDMITGMWIPTAVLFPIGLYLTYRANRDAIHIVSMDDTRRFFKNIYQKAKMGFSR
jgi:lipopolysaccharide export system permease protein